MVGFQTSASYISDTVILLDTLSRWWGPLERKVDLSFKQLYINLMAKWNIVDNLYVGLGGAYIFNLGNKLKYRERFTGSDTLFDRYPNSIYNSYTS